MRWFDRILRLLPARIRSSPHLAGLVLLALVYFAASFTLSTLRALEFQTSTWDFGLYQQAFWSTAHGRPFYDTADVETGGFQSLLQIHSVFLFYLLVPLYAALPFAGTLFAVQSLVVASAAFPLFLLARRVTGSSRLGLVAGVAYLAWMPTLSSNLYDFHVEAFLPVEIFGFAYLWATARYRWGFVAALVGFLTMELAPVLLFFVGLFYLLPARLELARWRERLRTAWRDPRVTAGIGLLVSCVVAYVALLYVRQHVLIQALGFHHLAAGGYGYVIGATPSELGLSASHVSVGFGIKLTNWFLLIALLGFVPFLAPRALLLAVPWFAFTMLSANLNYVAFGFQYGFVSGSALLIAFVYGLAAARRWVQRLEATSPSPSSAPPPASMGALGIRRTPGAWRSLRTGAYGAFALLLLLNVALTPADPLVQNGLAGSAYRISYQVPPGFADVQALVSLVPAGAVIVATDNLFPLVANNLNAYSFLWAADPYLYLPFNASDVPTYLLIAENRTYAVSPWLLPLLYNSTVYGVRGIVWSSIAGAVMLFEHGYTGPTRSFGPGPSLASPYYGFSLATQGAGLVVPLSGSPYPEGITSIPGTTGVLWRGPNTHLPAGNDTVTLGLRAQSTYPGHPASGSTPVLAIGVWAFGLPSLFYREYTFSALSSPDFLTARFVVSLPAPVMGFEIEGIVLDAAVSVDLEYLAISPGP